MNVDHCHSVALSTASTLSSVRLTLQLSANFQDAMPERDSYALALVLRAGLGFGEMGLLLLLGTCFLILSYSTGEA
jgi:hypothetical protein